MSEGNGRGTSGAGPRAYESFAESFEQAYRRLRITSAAAALSAGAVACNPPPEPSGQAGSTTTTHPGNTGGTTVGTGGATGGTGGVTGGTAGSTGGTGGVTNSTGGITGGTGGITGGTGGITGGTGGITGGTGGITGGTGGIIGGTGGVTGGTGGVTDPCAPLDPGKSGGVFDTSMVALASFSVVNTTKIKLKIRVKPVAGADLAQKAVLVTYRPFYERGPDSSPFLVETVVQATYASTLPDGNEEWQALIDPVEGAFERTPLLLFRLWYQDGAGGLYFDDNYGEQHAMHCLPFDSGAYAPCSIKKLLAELEISNAGFSGHVEATAPRLDPDDIAIFKWTPDNWTTVYDVPMTALPNDSSCSTLHWAVDINVPGTFAAIKYVLEYKHGTVNAAKEYKFWDDNNGAGYLVLK